MCQLVAAIPFGTWRVDSARLCRLLLQGRKNPHHKANQLARYISRIRCKDTKIPWNFQIMDKKFYILLFCRSSLVSQPIIRRSSRYPFSIQDKMPLITQNCASSGRDCTNSQALVPLASVVVFNSNFCSSLMSDIECSIIMN